MPPIAQPEPQQVPFEVQPSKSKAKIIILIVVVAFLILCAGGAIFAYVERMGPFARALYQEDDLMTGMFGKFAEIDSSTYKASAALYVMPREAGAVPFTAKNQDAGLKERYYRDSQRGESVSSLLSLLRYSNSGMDGVYPSNLKAVSAEQSDYYYDGPLDIIDPLTDKEYEYRVTDGGKNFALTVTFETPNAISAIKENNKYQEDKNMLISGRTVTFTKDSYTYIYLSSKPPQNFFETLSEYSAQLPSGINIKGSVEATADLRSEGMPAEWKFELDGEGDFGDLAYKLNIEALKNDKDYFLKINNFPALFGGFLPPKGQWIKFSTPNATSTDGGYDPYDSFIDTDAIAEAEEEYQERRSKIVEGLKNVAKFADEEKLFSFRNAPKKEKVDGRSLYRYDLKVRKDAILPFYRKLISADASFGDQGYLEYLESDAFSEAFDYFDENIKMTLWVDDEGFPAIATYSIRIVPGDEAFALKDKQIMLDFTISLDGINEPVNIDAPEGAKTYEELMKGNDPLSKARMKAKSAMIKASLSSLRAEAELAYDEGGNYGVTVFPLGPCTKTQGTLFGNERVFETISVAMEGNASKATCVSSLKNYAVSAPLPDSEGYSYCVDNTGTAKEILGTITATSCK